MSPWTLRTAAALCPLMVALSPSRATADTRPEGKINIITNDPTPAPETGLGPQPGSSTLVTKPYQTDGKPINTKLTPEKTRLVVVPAECPGPGEKTYAGHALLTAGNAPPPARDPACFSCPLGFRRTVFHVESDKACGKGLFGPSKKAKLVRDAKCGKGTFWDPRNGGECWSCPDGMERSLSPVDSKSACNQPLFGVTYSRANKYP